MPAKKVQQIIWPTKGEAAKFIASLKLHEMDLDKTLEAFSQGREGQKWCQENATLVAIYAIMTGQEDSFTTYGAGGHIAGAIGDKVYDFPTVASFKKLKLSLTPRNREHILEAAHKILGEIKKQKVQAKIAGLVDHAKRELEQAGLFDKDSDYDGALGDAVMELIEVFSKQGHSGFSAAIVQDLFDKLSRFKSLKEDPKEASTDEHAKHFVRGWRVLRAVKLLTEI